VLVGVSGTSVPVVVVTAAVVVVTEVGLVVSVVELTGLEVEVVEVADGVDDLEQDEKMDAAVPTIPTRITARLAGRRRATCEA
jgi:hypothetical protein